MYVLTFYVHTVPKQHQAWTALSYSLCLKESNKTTTSKRGVKLSHKMKYQLLCENPHRDYSVLKIIIIINVIIIIIINFLHYFINYVIINNYMHSFKDNFIIKHYISKMFPSPLNHDQKDHILIHK